jgi:putative nucleotidyltransferase with HDIG domain
MTSQEETLQKLNLRIRTVPTLPTAVTRLMALDIYADGAFDKVAQVAEEDPRLTMRLLAMANSAGFAPTTTITSIREALARVGVRRLMEMIYTMSMKQSLALQSAGEQALWSHSILTATAARFLAETFSELGVEPQTAYLCGLLHDMGRFVFFDGVPIEIQCADEFGWMGSEPLIAAEIAAVGIDHAEIGWRVCEQMGLPEHISEIVRYHHHDREQIEVEDIDLSLLGLVQVGEFMAAFLETPPDPLSLSREDLIDQIEVRGAQLPNGLGGISAMEIARLLPRLSDEAIKLIMGAAA